MLYLYNEKYYNTIFSTYIFNTLLSNDIFAMRSTVCSSNTTILRRWSLFCCNDFMHTKVTVLQLLVEFTEEWKH